jgi:hypothetical protein
MFLKKNVFEEVTSCLRTVWIADAAPSAAPITSSDTNPSQGVIQEVDESAPKTTLQIRLADGSRITGQL